LGEPSTECPEQARNVSHWQQNVAQALSGHKIGKVDKRPFREVPTISRIPPATSSEAIEKHHGAIGSQSVSEALHQDSLAHPARSMDNERKSNFTGEGRNVAKNIALNDYLNLGECVGRWIQPILVLHIQLS
jgi:hypothetical protein